MIARLQEWFHENPRARPLMMFAALALFCLLAGIWITARKPPGPTEPLNRTPEPVATDMVPTMTGGAEEPPVRSPRTAWIDGKDVPLRAQPDLKLPGIRTLQPWEEVFHIGENDVWDHIRLADGTEGWVRNREITFTKPANLDQPTPAEVAVMHFYAAVVRKDYTAAYHYLAGPWRSELDFNSFVEGYSHTNSLRTVIEQVVPMGEDRFQVDVGMVADEMGAKVDYVGSYLVEKIGDDWLMTSGSLTRKTEERPAVAPGEPAPLIEAAPSEMEESPGGELPDPIEEPDASESAAPEETVPPPTSEPPPG